MLFRSCYPDTPHSEGEAEAVTAAVPSASGRKRKYTHDSSGNKKKQTYFYFTSKKGNKTEGYKYGGHFIEQDIGLKPIA